MQEGKVVAFESLQLKDHEQKNLTHNTELVVVVFALKKLRHYLYGEKFVVISDYKSLEYIFAQKGLNLRQKRWFEYMSNYDFNVKYHLGKTIVVAEPERRMVPGQYGSIEWKMVNDLLPYDLGLMEVEEKLRLCGWIAWLALIDKVWEAHENNEDTMKIRDMIKKW